MIQEKVTLYESNQDYWRSVIESMKNVDADISSRMFALCLPRILRWVEKKGTNEMYAGCVKVSYRLLERFSGISPSTLQRIIKQWKKDEIVEVVYKRSENEGMFHTTLYIQPTEKFWNAKIQTSDVKNKSRNQKNYVPSVCCKGEEMKKEKKQAVYVCQGCGQLHILPAHKKKAIAVAWRIIREQQQETDEEEEELDIEEEAMANEAIIAELERELQNAPTL